MAVIVPILSLVVIFLILYQRQTQCRPCPCWRSSFLSASVVWFLLVAISTELLSLFNRITWGWVLSFWIAVLVVAGALYFYLDKRSGHPESPESGRFYGHGLMLSGAVLIAVVVGLISILCPPNNWDSMVYHSPKVVHWIQHQNISFYPTYVLRQNHQNPGAEYAIMHFQLLSGSDYFSNLIQWFAMVGCMIGASLIAGQLGVNKTGQYFAAVFTATLPMGIMQASSTQTDFFAAFWIVCLLHYILKLRGTDKPDWPGYVGVGFSLGLAILVKATAYLYAPFFLLWLTLSQLKLHRAKAIAPLFVAAALALAINSGHLLRNYDLYGSPLGPKGEEGNQDQGFKYTNDIYTPKAFASNILRNIGTHIAGTPIKSVNGAAQKAIEKLHTWMGVDVNDPKTTWAGTQFAPNPTPYLDEVDGNPVHLVLILLALPFVFLFAKREKSGGFIAYSVAAVAVFGLLCFYLRWGPWHSRIHTGFFVLMAPVVAVVVSGLLNRHIVSVLAAILMVCAVPWLLWCVQKPLVGSRSIFTTPRNEQYFGSPGMGIQEPYLNAKAFLRDKKFDRIGLILTPEPWEYPMLMLLRQDNPAIRFQHVNVENVSSRLYANDPFKEFSPEAVIEIRLGQAKQLAQKTEVLVNGQVFRRQWLQGPVAIYFNN